MSADWAKHFIQDSNRSIYIDSGKSSSYRLYPRPILSGGSAKMQSNIGSFGRILRQSPLIILDIVERLKDFVTYFIKLLFIGDIVSDYLNDYLSELNSFRSVQ